jgi:type I restriction enzyme, S subunit
MTLTPIESLTNLPQGWEARRLKFIVDRFYSGSTPSTTNPEYWNGEHPWVSSKDMKSAEILDTEDHITELALEETNLRLLPPGQILMVVRSGV